MKIILVRHGQTNYNVKDRCNGLPNTRVSLTSLGKKQSLQVAKKLAKEKIEVIFISKLFRTQQTAEIINLYHKVKIYSDKRLNDRLMGEFEGRPATLFYDWRAKQKNRWTSKPKNGESYEQLKARVISFLNILTTKKYKTVLIVTHLPIVKIVRGYIKKLSNQAMDRLTEKNIPNCHVAVFKLKARKK